MGVAFDKLNFMKRLETGGTFTRPQAEILSEALHEAVVESVATKQDVETVRHEVALGSTELRHEMATQRTELRQEMATVGVELRQEMATLGVELRQEMATLGVELRTEMATLGTELRQEISILGSDLRHETTLIRSEAKVDVAELKASIADSKVWAVSVGATIIAVLAAMKYFG